MYVHIVTGYPPIKLINTSITSHIYPFLFERTFMFFALGKFRLYNTVLSTIATLLYIRSSDFIHLITASLYPLPSLPYST